MLGPKVTLKAVAGQRDSDAMEAEDLRTYRANDGDWSLACAAGL